MTTPRSLPYLALAAVAASFAVLYAPVATSLVSDWATDDNYSHGFIIVPFAVYFAWERRARLASVPVVPSLLGLGVALAGMGVLLVGLLGAERFLTRLSMLLVLTGSLAFVRGWAAVRVMAFPLAFLLLMIPIPAIIFNRIAFPLQLLASRVGETALAALAIPVLREGNLIVLARTTLEVAEACSGIRSLISLLTLGIIYGYFVDLRPIVRTTIALSTIPIAILANGVRVAGTGIAAHYLGDDVAEGFFHSFSGWLMFVVAFGLLFLTSQIVLRFLPASRPATAPAPVESVAQPYTMSTWRLAMLSVCMLAATVMGVRAMRPEMPPLREPFARLPLSLDAWSGYDAPAFEPRILEQLGVDEYLHRIYQSANRPLSLYVGYYQSQRSGDTIHSPQNCLPGAGWLPVRSSRLEVQVQGRAGPITINRLLIQKGIERQVVLYWYQSHGRVVASEYWSKAFLVYDAVRLNRSDAAMVRVITPVLDGEESEHDAEQRALAFVSTIFPQLDRFLPL